MRIGLMTTVTFLPIIGIKKWEVLSDNKNVAILDNLP